MSDPRAAIGDALLPALFDYALSEMGRQDGVWGPCSFRDYAARTAAKASRTTPEYISIDHFDRLPSALRREQTMVLRLGEATGTGTQFALVRVSERLSDFFLFDAALFGGREIETFLPRVGLHQLYPFTLLRSLAETNLVNLAFASGVLSVALELDDEPAIVPATGRSRYSFIFRPHSSLADMLEHRRGQVEIDALFVARRHRRQCLFVVEAKVGPPNGSLAKHKLLYGAIPCREQAPQDMPVIPVYLKLSPTDRGLEFNIAECEPLPSAPVCLDALNVRVARRLVIPAQILTLA